jgi:hypothetical protein
MLGLKVLKALLFQNIFLEPETNSDTQPVQRYTSIGPLQVRFRDETASVTLFKPKPTIARAFFHTADKSPIMQVYQ